jgi:hypothetical protein
VARGAGLETALSRRTQGGDRALGAHRQPGDIDRLAGDEPCHVHHDVHPCRPDLRDGGGGKDPSLEIAPLGKHPKLLGRTEQEDGDSAAVQMVDEPLTVSDSSGDDGNLRLPPGSEMKGLLGRFRDESRKSMEAEVLNDPLQVD